jgi:hypothetical protein
MCPTVMGNKGLSKLGVGEVWSQKFNDSQKALAVPYQCVLFRLGPKFDMV